MYYLSVGSLFKNEAHILAEWLDHYIHHGVEKFYLINDNSTDNFMEVLQPYIDSDLVVLFNVREPVYQYRQANLYDRFLLPVLQRREVQWMAVIDLDEFLYSPQEKDIRKVLKKYEHIGQIQLNMIDFGSNGHVKQPKNVVESFTKRKRMLRQAVTKNIINSNFYTVLIGVHESHVYGERKNLSLIDYNDSPESDSNSELLLNHYRIQSVEFWQNVKMTRGDSDCYNQTRDMEEFKRQDVNDVEDLRLAKQNVDISITLKVSNNYNCELPQNTFHKYVSSLINGSKYGTDGVVSALLEELTIPNKIFVQCFTDDFQCLPCMYKDYHGNVDNNFSMFTGYHYMKVSKRDLSSIPDWGKNYMFLSLNLSLWKRFGNSPYHYSDPKIVLVNLESTGLSDFLDGVKSLIERRYIPVAFCKKVVIGVLSLYVHELKSFPYTVGYKETDYLYLYTNLYCENNNWYYDKGMEDDMCVRNFYIKYSRIPGEEDKPILEEHKKKNQSLLWKPLINF